MKPVMLMDGLQRLTGDDKSMATTPLLTPTTLKTITQLLESDECLASVPVIEQLALPDEPLSPPQSHLKPPAPTVVCRKKTYTKLDSNSWQGGTTTVLTPTKVDPPALTLPATLITLPSTPKRRDVTPMLQGLEAADFEDDDQDEDYSPVKRPRRMLTRSRSVRRTRQVYSPTMMPNATKGERKATSKRRGNLKDDYDQLSNQEERERLRMRRERNKQAAARCRKRRLDLTNSLMGEVRLWESKNQLLEKEIRQLKTQLQGLEYILMSHSSSCTTLRLVDTDVAIKTEPDLYEMEPLLTEPSGHRSSIVARKRPASLMLSLDKHKPGPDHIDGIVIDTPSNIIPSFDSLLASSSSTGLTPPIACLATPVFYPALGSASSTCSTQQRTTEVPDLNTPICGESVSLVSL